ncbi:MAG: flagellar hook-associated protein FlgK [bacterium]
MYGLFNALELGKRALIAQQFAMSNTGHNIANVNTPGYSRQRVTLEATRPLYTTQGNVGTGVVVSNIVQIRDLFLTEQYRKEQSNLSRWETTNHALAQIETFINEPSDGGMNQLLTDFWNSWEDLSVHPDASATIIESAQVLVNAFHEYSEQLASLRESVDDDISESIRQINGLARQVADLNRQVMSQELGGRTANDLRDRRNYLIDQIAQYTDVRTVEQKGGSVSVYLGSMSLVEGQDYLSVATEERGSIEGSYTVAYWEDTTFEIDFSGGQLLALTDLRDKLIPQAQDELDAIAQALVEQVNAVHRQGVGSDGSTGVNFFDPYLTDAINIRLNPEVAGNPAKLAVSLSGEPGDVRNAQALSDLRSAKVLGGGSLTINEAYGAMTSTIGIRVGESQTLKENYELLVMQVENSRQAIQGVSIDEEMANMIKYQRAYEAAARIITYTDEALDTVINGMGVTR